MEMERVLEYQDHYAKETTNKKTYAIMSGFHTEGGGGGWGAPWDSHPPPPESLRKYDVM